MKKYFSAALVILFLSNCSSVQKHNALLESNLSVKEQIEDVNYLERKIEKIQPSLHQFISEEDLRRKFDSVRSTINIPLKPNEFYFKVSPLLAAVRQGHASMNPIIAEYSRKESKEMKKKGLGPVSQFDYKFIDNKLFIMKNKSKDSTIQAGTEVVSIEDITPQDLFSKYRKTFSSDGFNETFIPYAFTMRFGNYLFYELGLRDSLNFNLKCYDSVYTKLIKRFPDKKTEKKEEKKDSISTAKTKEEVVKKLTKEEKKLAKKKKREQDEYNYNYGYDKTKKKYTKTLTFTDIDSCTAIFKIRNFSKGGYKTAYKEVFELLRNTDTKNLVLDLRGNPGGRLNEIHELYSYLTADSTFQLIEEAKVTSKTSLLQADYLSSMPKSLYVLAIPTYPFYASVLMLKTRKDENGEYRFRMKSSKEKPHKANYFKGKIYVLINGGSFSAACIISSKLKENTEITFVGEETGGAFNGTVAGRTSSYELPNSKLRTRLWIMDIAATNKTEEKGRGIFPDVEIVPTIDDILSGIDPELEWIKKDIQNKK
ncbi:S41 family peptidase [uncultured Flavobacterium sp.]|uniref:S41 family peptidase n=1 Tax=uncultured Flavobacterium sp. TaxID=165435 RepID=UPI0030C7EBB9